MKRTTSPQNQEPDQELIELLKVLESHKVEYPPQLLAARRADFIAQVQQRREAKTKQVLASNGHFTKRLKELKSVKAEYPADLLAARRAAFVAQVEQRNSVAVTEELPSKDQELVKLFNAIKSTEADYQYPPKLMAARRSAFRRQLALGGGSSLLETLRSSIRSLFLFKLKMPSFPMASLMRTSLVVAVLMVAAFAASLLKDREQVLSPAPSQEEISQPLIPTTTSTSEPVTVICKPGDQSPLCPPEQLEESQDLAFQGNGAARPAVAKDALSSNNEVIKASNVNDGRDGAGWVSSSAYSWLKIDLGKVATINTVTLDKANLSSYRDRNVGQFVIAVALSDVYAEGNSSNDFTEYTEVYDSEQTNFSGFVSDSETIRALFGPVRARYVKIIFKEPGAAINEVRVFMAQPNSWVDNPPTRKPTDKAPASVSTPVPVYNTSVPTNTALPAPTNTAIPPTATPIPTDPPPTRTPLPTDPPPTRTPLPTDPPPTDIPPTPIPPTDIPTEVQPGATPITLLPIDISEPPAEPSAEVSAP